MTPLQKKLETIAN
jgi:P-type Ca2+ transporter type 2B